MDHAVQTGTRTTGTCAEADPCAQLDALTLGAGVSHRAITDRILELAYASGHKAALIDAPQGVVTSWPRFGWMVTAAADGLRRRGLADGDAAGVLVQDAASFALAVNAIRAAGAVPSPIAPGASMAEVAARLNACGARVLITASPLAELAAEAADRSRVRQVFSFGDAPGTTPFRSLLGAAKHGAPDVPDAPDASVADGDERGLTQHGRLADFTQPGFALSHRDVVVTCPPCGDGPEYTSLLDLILLTGATVVAAPVGLITAAMRAYKGTAAIVPRDTVIPGLAADRVFGVA